MKGAVQNHHDKKIAEPDCFSHIIEVEIAITLRQVVSLLRGKGEGEQIHS